LSKERKVTLGVFCQHCGWLHTIVPNVRLNDVEMVTKSFRGYICLHCRRELTSPKVMLYHA